MDRSDVSEANSTAAATAGGGPGVAGGVAPPAGEQAVPAPPQPSEVSMERTAQPQAPPAEEKSGK